jgi:hypothetical protein
MGDVAAPLPARAAAFDLAGAFLHAPGWQPPARTEVRVRLPGGTLRLHCLARTATGVLVFHHGADVGRPALAYAERVEAHRRLQRRGPALSVFTDALQCVQHWHWTERARGAPPTLCSFTHHRGAPPDELGRTLAGWLAREAAPRPRHRRGVHGAAGVRAAVVQRLLREIARRQRAALSGSAASRPETMLAAARRSDVWSQLHGAIETSRDAAWLRACWHALASPGFAVLDAACGRGDRLLLAAEVLESLYVALLRRAQSWAPPEHPPARRLGELHDAAALAALTAAPPRWTARFLVLQRNLFGAERDAARLDAARVRLLDWLHATASDTAAPAAVPLLGLCAGTLALPRRGDWARLLRALGAARSGPVDDALEAANALASACAQLRRQPPEPAGDPTRAAVAAQLQARRQALYQAAGWDADPGTRGELQPALEFPDVMRRGGFALVLAGASAGAAR